MAYRPAPQDPEIRTAARLAGAMYLATTVTANFSEFYARGQLAKSQEVFRLGTVSDLVTTIGVIVLVLALYTVLRPVDRNLALAALVFRLVESAVFAAITLVDFIALRFLNGASYLGSFDAAQVTALSKVFDNVHADGYLVGLLFFGAGSTLFAYVWWKSRFIPRALSGLGVFASALVLVGTLGIIAAPELVDVLIPAYFAPIFLFEVSLGIWLVTRGVKVGS